MRNPVPPSPTPESIALARAAQLRERAAFTLDTGIEIEDDGRIALLIGNSIAVACYGVRGEWRDRHES